jgi:hypothetical protein
MRFATIKIAETEQLDLSVTALPTMASVEDQRYTLSNINRWRQQLQLPPIDQAELAELERVEMKNAQALVVDMTGRLTRDAMSPGPLPQSAPATSPPPADTKVDLAYDTPEGWKPGTIGAFARLAFDIDSEGKQASVTVSQAGGDLLSNVNRWRQQVQLTPLTAEQLPQEMQPIEVDSIEGHYVKLVGPAADQQPAKAILGVILVRQGESWFFKLTGDAAVAQQQEENFKSFVRSVKFSTG